MSKKTNALKRTPRPKPRKKRKNTSMQRYGPNVPFLPIFPAFSLTGMALDLLFGNIRPAPRNAWVCDPCGVQVDLVSGAGPANFCPKCRGSMRPLGVRPAASTVDPGPNCIDATAEDVTYKRLPAPASGDTRTEGSEPAARPKKTNA